MAAVFLSTATPSSSSSSSSSSSLARPRKIFPHNKNVRKLVLCKGINEPKPISSTDLTKRNLSLCLVSSFVFSVAGKKDWSVANAAILEADDDVELLEKVKKDRKKRLERQGVISSSNTEKGYLQELVYNLSKVGQAIDNNDLPAASSVLGETTSTDWIQKANLAFSKLSSSAEEKSEVDAFNSSVASLISSVKKKDVESSKIAFVTSASALEKWTALTGLVGQLKGL